MAVAAALTLWLRRPARRLRRIALRELRQLEDGSADDAALARGLEHLLRRYAVARFGREPVARLSGEPWIAFVVARGGAALAGEPGRDLLRAAYGGKGGASREMWVKSARGISVEFARTFWPMALLRVGGRSCRRGASSIGSPMKCSG